LPGFVFEVAGGGFVVFEAVHVVDEGADQAMACLRDGVVGLLFGPAYGVDGPFARAVRPRIELHRGGHHIMSLKTSVDIYLHVAAHTGHANQEMGMVKSAI